MAHPLGANDVGQDLLSELIYGARVSLLIGLAAAVMATLVGTTVGLLAGFFRGMTDAVLMRGVDVLLALPFLPLDDRARRVRRAGSRHRGRRHRRRDLGANRPGDPLPGAVAARAELRRGGARDGSALRLPDHSATSAPAVAPLVIPQLVRAANVAILLDASLGFLGLGDPAAKSWGMMLYYANARSAFLTDAWLWWVLPPGICIAAVVLGFALIGYALEERSRPRLRAAGGGRIILPAVEATRLSRSRPRPLDRPDRPLVVDNLTVEYATTERHSARRRRRQLLDPARRGARHRRRVRQRQDDAGDDGPRAAPAAGADHERPRAAGR